MDTRKVASEYRQAQWGQMIQARVQSGQSIKEFCASVGVMNMSAAFYTPGRRGKLTPTAAGFDSAAVGA